MYIRAGCAVLRYRLHVITVSAHAFLTMYYAVLVKTVCFYFHLCELVILKLLGHSIKTLCCFKENMSVGITQYDNEICAKSVCQHSTTEICSIT